MPKLIILKGLQASGKTTLAKAMVDVIGYKRVNKDDLRDMIDCGKYSPFNKSLISQIEMSIARLYLDHGFNVVVDDTNLTEDRIKFIKDNIKGVEIVEQFVDTPLEECVRRDKLRGDKKVGENVIRNLNKKLGMNQN